MTEEIQKAAPQIWEAIQKSHKVLLCCHPSPDPDSVGSVLAMMHLLKGLGKEVTAIAGDSELQKSFSALPGLPSIEPKNYFQVDISQFDLFILLDYQSADRISTLKEVTFPDSLKTVIIDHHLSNDSHPPVKNLVSLVDHSFPVCQILFYLFKLWQIKITPEIAVCLFVGLHGDTGGFQYPKTTPESFLVASELVKIYPNFSEVMFQMENSKEAKRIEFLGLALSSIEHYFDDKVAVSVIPYEKLQERGIKSKDTENSEIANTLKSVIGWELGILCLEKEPNKVNFSLRTRDAQKHDVAKIAQVLGGGGHPTAAGATIFKPFSEAKKLLLEAIQQTYPDLGQP